MPIGKVDQFLHWEQLKSGNTDAENDNNTFYLSLHTSVCVYGSQYDLLKALF